MREMRSSFRILAFRFMSSMIHYVGGRAVPIHLREERDFLFDVDELCGLITDRTKLIILSSRTYRCNETSSRPKSLATATSLCCRTRSKQPPAR